jgi:hypothetical protein
VKSTVSLLGLGACVAAALIGAAQFSPNHREDGRPHTLAWAQAEPCAELICFAVYAVDVEDLNSDFSADVVQPRPREARKLASLSGGAWAMAFSDDGRTLFFLRASTTAILPDGFLLDLWSLQLTGGDEVLIRTNFVEWDPLMPPLGVLLGQRISHDARSESGVSYRAVETPDGRYTALHTFGSRRGRVSSICITDSGLDELDLAAARCFEDGTFGASDPVWIER